MADGSLREIIFTLKDIRDGEVLEQPAGKSVFEKAKPAILNFPVLVSDLLSLEDLTMINKALEREYATVVRLAMGLDDVIDGGNDRRLSKIDYIQRFHTNDYGSKDHYLWESVNHENLRESYDLFTEEYKEIDTVNESYGFNLDNLNDMTNKNNHNYVNLSEERITRKKETTDGGNVHNRSWTNTDTTGSSNGISTTRGGSDTNSITRSGGGNGRNGGAGRGGNSSTYSSMNSNSTQRKKDSSNSSSKQKGGYDTIYEPKTVDSVTREYNSLTAYNDYHAQLLDNDVKKANELIPTTLDITVYQKVGEETITDHILLGVKCTSHKVQSKDVIENIYQTVENKKAFFRFIQWTTGEIKFFKDYLLCLDTLKKEALRSRAKDRSGIWFRELKNRATISKLRSSFNLKNQLIPNSTLVVAMDEIDMLRNMYNIDLLNDIKKVEQLMSTYFLIGFVIVDPASEIAYFKFDGFTKYQTYSYRSLERENRNQGNDIKSLVSLMSKF